MIEKTIKRRKVNIKRSAIKKIEGKSFIESLTKLKQDWKHLLKCNALSKDAKFLRRMALNIKQIHYDIKQSKHPKGWESETEKLLKLLSTTETKVSLLEAADKFGDQEPSQSDLAELMGAFAQKKSLRV